MDTGPVEGTLKARWQRRACIVSFACVLLVGAAGQSAGTHATTVEVVAGESAHITYFLAWRGKPCLCSIDCSVAPDPVGFSLLHPPCIVLHRGMNRVAVTIATDWRLAPGPSTVTASFQALGSTQPVVVTKTVVRPDGATMAPNAGMPSPDLRALLGCLVFTLLCLIGSIGGRTQ